MPDYNETRDWVTWYVKGPIELILHLQDCRDKWEKEKSVKEDEADNIIKKMLHDKWVTQRED